MHFPGHVREAFQELIYPVYQDRVLLTDEHARLAGQLWHCTDILPAGDCDIMEIAHGSTYAQAARELKKDLPMLSRTVHAQKESHSGEAQKPSQNGPRLPWAKHVRGLLMVDHL